MRTLLFAGDRDYAGESWDRTCSFTWVVVKAGFNISWTISLGLWRVGGKTSEQLLNSVLRLSKRSSMAYWRKQVGVQLISWHNNETKCCWDCSRRALKTAKRRNQIARRLKSTARRSASSF